MLRVDSFVLLVILILYFEPPVVFFGKKKLVGSDITTAREWKLSLSSDIKFTYSIIDITTLKKGDIVKKDTTIYDGLWRYDGDTLFLYSDACPDIPKNEIKYLRKNKYLYSLGYCIDSFGNGKIERLRAHR